MKILGRDFSYNNAQKMGKKFLPAISNIPTNLKIRRLRKLTLENRNLKTLARSKIVPLALASIIPWLEINGMKNVNEPSWGIFISSN